MSNKYRKRLREFLPGSKENPTGGAEHKTTEVFPDWEEKLLSFFPVVHRFKEIYLVCL
jgi:hypothetical protein